MEEKKTNEFAQEAAVKLHPLLLLREVANKFVAIIMVMIIVMSCTFVFSRWIYTPNYVTRTTFTVSVRNGSTSVFSNLGAAESAAKSLSKVLSSAAMKKQIAKELEVKRVPGTINADIIEETNILEVYVTATSPREAYRIMTALLDNYGPITAKVLDDVILDPLQYPTVPTVPVNQKSFSRPVIMSGIAAMMVMMVLICVVTYLRDTVKTSSDVEAKLDTKLLSTIQHETKYKTLKSKIQRKKKSILITDATTGFGFVETFKKLRTRIDYSMRKKGYKVLLVSSAFEDEGKSTVAVNIALAMKRKYRNVLIVDADMKKSALHKIMEYKNREYTSLNSVLEGEAEIEDAIIKDKETGLNLIFAQNCGERSTQLVSSERMRETISYAKKVMDVIVVDTPPMTAGIDTECIADVADAAVIVVRQNMTPARIINDMIDVINDSHAELLGCVLNNYSAADLDDALGYGQGRYGYGRYGYGKYGYGKYGYGRYGHMDSDKERRRRSSQNEEEV